MLTLSRIPFRVHVAVSFIAASACTTYDPSLLTPRRTTTTGDAAESSTTSTGAGGTGSSNATVSTVSAGGTGGTSASADSSGADSSSSGSTTSGAGGGAGENGQTATTGSGDCESGECCPEGSEKLSPGQCGCDQPDIDSDLDEIADCIDACPEDPDKSEPGECGCGVREQDTAQGAGCLSLKQGLAHRYSFGGRGTEVTDTQGGAHGRMIGTTLSGTGVATLSAGGEQYVELPSGRLSELWNATLEGWFVWGGDQTWTRLFDFGNTQEGVAGEPGTGYSFVMFTVNNADAQPYAAFSVGDSATEVSCAANDSLVPGVLHHMALSLDVDNATLTLFIDGMLSCAIALPFELSQIDDVNAWLGRSQFETDDTFSGSIDEFRIYDIALTRQQVAFSFSHGPDPDFLDD